MLLVCLSVCPSCRASLTGAGGVFVCRTVWSFTRQGSKLTVENPEMTRLGVARSAQAVRDGHPCVGPGGNTQKCQPLLIFLCVVYSPLLALFQKI